jgi:small GTP-binding protein
MFFPIFDSEQVLSCLNNSLNLQGQAFTQKQREELQARIEELVNYQAVVGIMGKTGGGKSSLCNALFGQDVAEVDDIAACTRYPQEYTLAYKNGKGIALIDVPGVGESLGRDQEYAELYQRLLPELDLILWVVKADDRALSIDQQVFNSVIRPYLADRDIPVLFVISQVDKVAPCGEWDRERHLPGNAQQSNLSRKQIQLSQTFDISLDHICATSSEEGYGLTGLVEQIVTLLPNQKKWAIAREAKPEYVSGKAYQTASKGLWETIKDTATTMLREGWAVIANKVESWLGKLFSW